MSNTRSNVPHHPLIAEESPVRGLSPIDSPEGSPARGMSPDRLLADLDMDDFTSPHDPSLNLLEVPDTNWTRGSQGSASSSLASSTCDMTANLYDTAPSSSGLKVSLPPAAAAVSLILFLHCLVNVLLPVLFLLRWLLSILPVVIVVVCCSCTHLGDTWL